MKENHIKLCFIAVTFGFLVMAGAFGVLTQRVGQLLKWHMELEQEVKVLKNKVEATESNRQTAISTADTDQAIAPN